MAPRSINTLDGRNIVIINSSISEQRYICSAEIEPVIGKAFIVPSSSVGGPWLVEINASCPAYNKVSMDVRGMKAILNPIGSQILWNNSEYNVESYLHYSTQHRVTYTGNVTVTAPQYSTTIVAKAQLVLGTGTDDPGTEVPYPKGWRPTGDTDNTFGNRAWDLDDWPDLRKLRDGGHYALGTPEPVPTPPPADDTWWPIPEDPAIPDITCFSAEDLAWPCTTGVSLIYPYIDECFCKRIKLYFHAWTSSRELEDDGYGNMIPIHYHELEHTFNISNHTTLAAVYVYTL